MNELKGKRYLTTNELAKLARRDPSRIRQLCRGGRYTSPKGGPGLGNHKTRGHVMVGVSKINLWRLDNG